MVHNFFCGVSAIERGDDDFIVDAAYVINGLELENIPTSMLLNFESFVVYKVYDNVVFGLYVHRCFVLVN